MILTLRNEVVLTLRVSVVLTLRVSVYFQFVISNVICIPYSAGKRQLGSNALAR